MIGSGPGILEGSDFVCRDKIISLMEISDETSGSKYFHVIVITVCNMEKGNSQKYNMF